MLTDLGNEITNYWEGESCMYNDSIRREIKSANANVWLEIIQQHTPNCSTPVSVLDLGVGPGFFPLILPSEQYRITGVDCSEKMIREAKRNMKIAGKTAALFVMDAHDLKFPDNAFDMIIARRTFWTLYDPLSAYKECERVLKPGGHLLVIDGNYYNYLYHPAIASQKQKDLQKAEEKRITRHSHTDIKKSEQLGNKLFLSIIERPAWDINQLKRLQFTIVHTNTQLIRSFNDEALRLFWGYANIFLIVAQKQAQKKIKTQSQFF